MKSAPFVILGVIAVAFIFGAITVQALVWQECRQDHSWFYCLSLISR